MNKSTDLLVDQIIRYLQVPQEIYDPPKSEKPDFYPFPVEFEYIGRCLHRLGNNFFHYKIMDLKEPTFLNAVVYCITGGTKEKMISKHLDHQTLCDQLEINVLVIGPDEQQISTWLNQSSKIVNQPKNKDYKPFVILFRSYDDLYYPIITLEKKEHYVYYRHSNNILQQLLPESST